MRVGDIVSVERYDDGIIIEDQFIYLGDGIYAPFKPEIECGDQGESSDTDNNVCWRSEEDREGSEDGDDNTGPVHEVRDPRWSFGDDK